MTNAAHTEAALKKMKKADLETIASSDYEIEEEMISGMTKAQLIEAILDHNKADEVDDDELDDDELDDEIDDELDDEAEAAAEDDELDDDELDDEPEPAKPAPKAKKEKKPTRATDGEATLAAKQVAQMVNTDPKTLRAFFRSPASTTEPVGSGGRYEFLEGDIDKIKKEFAAWAANKGTRGRPTADGTPKKRAAKKELPAEKIADEVEELDDLDELEDELDEFDDEI